MKKLVVLIIPILLLTACTSNEEDKIAYLEYKNELEKQETFSPEDELDFNVYFNISKEVEEITNYSILINNPKVNMHKVKALLIHNYIIDEAYPSIGIMDKPVELLKDNNNKIELKGKIQTSENISNVKYKLYIEYTTDVSNKDYAKAETLEPVNINDFREDYGYLLSRHYDKPKAKKKHWYIFKG